MSRVAGVIALWAFSSACQLDPGTSPVEIGEHRLEPASVVFGRTHYEDDGPAFFDQKYNVTWVVVSDHLNVCEALTESSACDGDDAVGPEWPDGLHFEVVFNSFAEGARSELDESPHRYNAQFRRVQDGTTTFFERATEGSLSSVDVDDGHAWGRYRASSDEGMDLDGSFSAEHCPAMDLILWKQLYERPRCP